MRLDVRFDRPLDDEERIRFLLAIACLAKSRAVRWRDGGAVIVGEAMGRERVAEALAQAAIPVADLTSSLVDDERDRGDVSLVAEATTRERVRPMGR